jgi:hypothetical protein
MQFRRLLLGCLKLKYSLKLEKQIPSKLYLLCKNCSWISKMMNEEQIDEEITSDEIGALPFITKLNTDESNF